MTKVNKYAQPQSDYRFINLLRQQLYIIFITRINFILTKSLAVNNNSFFLLFIIVIQD